MLSTYQSSPQIEAAFALGRVPGFDLVIADEAHRVAGPVSSDFATVLDPAVIRGERRLFDGHAAVLHRPVAQGRPRYSTSRWPRWTLALSSDRCFTGLSSESIDDLPTDYQVAVVGVDDATYREWAENGTLVSRDGKQIDNAATLAGQIGLAKAMRKYDLRRVISFHSRVKRARSSRRRCPK